MPTDVLKSSTADIFIQAEIPFVGLLLCKRGKSTVFSGLKAVRKLKACAKAQLQWFEFVKVY